MEKNKMDLQKIKKRKSERKDVVVTMRITRSQSEWLRNKDYSPNAILQEAILDLQKGKK